MGSEIRGRRGCGYSVERDLRVGALGLEIDRLDRDGGAVNTMWRGIGIWDDIDLPEYCPWPIQMRRLSKLRDHELDL